MDKKKMKRFAVLVVCLALSCGAMARGGGGGGGHGGGGHASGHASGESGGHGGEGEGESSSGHSEEESSSTSGRVILIPHGSSTVGVCKDGVDSTQDISASETQVQCNSDTLSAGKLVLLIGLVAIIVVAIAAALMNL